ncbi:MAG: FHA domain-containing protein, partial [Myxococcota bacterium]|nr:FHA domain-containing protein [Myxococcota bacterium]
NPRTIITKESQIRLGRSSSACDILLQGSGVSKIHALLVQHGDTIFIRDLQSTNGVRYMSGENIPAGFIKLAPYEKVRIQTFQLHARPHHANAFTEER